MTRKLSPYELISRGFDKKDDNQQQEENTSQEQEMSSIEKLINGYKPKEEGDN